VTDYVHPGYVYSRNDGDRHYIGFVQLCRLYGLNPYRCVNAGQPENMLGRRPQEGDRHFYPRKDGNYELGPES
jgi:hypothetical protein